MQLLSHLHPDLHSEMLHLSHLLGDTGELVPPPPLLPVMRTSAQSLKISVRPQLDRPTWPVMGLLRAA